MSLMAGIASRDFRTPVPEELGRALGRSLSRRGGRGGARRDAPLGAGARRSDALRPDQACSACHLLHYTSGGKEQRRYRDWGAVRPHRSVDAGYFRELHTCFDQAVALGRRRGRAVRAFLTGGMDSRAIVTTPVEQGAAVESHCFAEPASLHRPTVLAMYAITRTRLRDYGWALDPSWRVFDVFRRSNGRAVIPPGAEVPLEHPPALRTAALPS